MISQQTLTNIENFKKEHKYFGQDWTDWREAPCSWVTMRKYPEIFETKVEIFEMTDEEDEEEVYETWTEVRKSWRFKR